MRKLVLIDRGSMRRCELAGLILAVVLLFPSFFVVASFSAAELPEQAARRGLQMPSGWDAGVFSHGGYYRWYTIEQHPAFFAVGMIGLLGSLGYFGFLITRALLRERQKQTGDGQGDR